MQYFRYGGLPGACFIRNDAIRTQKIRDQIETILNLDLRQVYPTTLTLRELFGFLEALARRDGEMIEHATLKRETGISPITQKKLLFALESVFLIRILGCEGDFKGFSVLFEDQAEALVCSKERLEPLVQWTGLVYRNLREQVFYNIGANFDFFQYRTRGGAFIPIGLRLPGCTLGFLPILGDLNRSAIASAHSFLRKFSDSRVIFVTDQNLIRILDERMAILPATALLFYL